MACPYARPAERPFPRGLMGVGRIAVLPDFIDQLKAVNERDVQLGDELGTEYRGVRHDGTYIRRVVTSSEAVSFQSADRSSIEYFDKIVDSLCWLRRD